MKIVEKVSKKVVVFRQNQAKISQKLGQMRPKEVPRVAQRGPKSGPERSQEWPQWGNSGKHGPGPVPRGVTRIRTVPIPHYPGTHHPPVHQHGQHQHCRCSMSEGSTVVRQASFGYSPVTKIPLCLKLPFSVCQNGP